MADVTVVVPTHDRDELLKEALASVLAQDLREGDELAGVIVSDDRGWAATRAVVDAVAAVATVPVSYVDSSGPGAGTAGASRNAGARHVTSAVVAFLDDDDRWEPSFLRQTLAAMDEQDADFAVTWLRPDREDYRMARMRPGLTVGDVVARNPGFTGSNFVIRTAAFRALRGFDPSLNVSNDKDLLVRALLAGQRYAVVPAELVRYRVHAAGQLTDKTLARAAGLRRYADKHADLLTSSDRRILRAQLSSVLRVAAPSGFERLRHSAVLGWNRALLKMTAVAR